ncbi:MAG: VWA domain-containing protein [Chloroflexi bacterium]|nr:VWA domain-containing protein [Chloroflexota bacterium]
MRRYNVLITNSVIVLVSLIVLIVTALIWANGRIHLQPATASTQPDQPQAITDPIDCNIASSLFVGIDISQGQDPNDAVTFLTDLENDGFAVGTFDLGNGIPSCLNVILVFGGANGGQLDGVYPASQGTTLLNWVNSGGGLMLFGDWGFFKTNIDPLFQAFGYAQQGDDAGIVSDPTDFDPVAPAIVGETWVIYQNDNFLPHPAFAGVTTIELLRSSWLNNSAATIVQTDNDADPSVVPVLAAFVQGSGCVTLSTDTDWVGEINSGYQKENNALFARQMVNWLTNCNILSLSKQADSSTAEPGDLITFTITAVNNRETAVSGIVITDTIPVGTTFVNASSPFTGPDVNNVITWSLGSLVTGTETAVTLTVQVNNNNNNPTVNNTAWLQSSQGDDLSASVTVEIINEALVAAAGGTYTVSEGNTVQLDGTSSSGGDTLTYSWDFDNDSQFDDAVGATPQFSAVVLDDGVFPIALQVETQTGDTAVDSTTVTVINVPPTVSISPDSLTTTIGIPLNFSGAFTDPGNQDTHIITWNFGDGSTQTNGSLNTSHTYTHSGVFTVNLSVADDDEGSGQATEKISVFSLEGTLDIYLPIIAHNFCMPKDNYSDISLIIDVSGSMGELTYPGGPTKLEAAKEAAIEFVNLLTFPSDQAAIVTFGNNSQLVHSLSSDRVSLINALQGITLRGASRIDLGLQEGHVELNSLRHDPSNQSIIIILTDGHPSEVDLEEVILAADAAKADSIQIYSIGLGSDVNTSLMEGIATDATFYYFAPTATELNNIYDQIAADINCQ